DLQRVAVFGERLAAVVGDHHQVLEADAADIALPQSGLDREHVAGHERLAIRHPEAGILVDAQPDAVPERELEAPPGIIAGAGPLGPVPRTLEHLAGDVEELPAADAGSDRRPHRLDRLAHERLLPAHLLGRLAADDERARHVGPAFGL